MRRQFCRRESVCEWPVSRRIFKRGQCKIELRPLADAITMSDDRTGLQSLIDILGSPYDSQTHGAGVVARHSFIDAAGKIVHSPSVEARRWDCSGALLAGHRFRASVSSTLTAALVDKRSQEAFTALIAHLSAFEAATSCIAVLNATAGQWRMARVCGIHEIALHSVPRLEM